MDTGRTARRLPRRLGIDPTLAQHLAESLSPAMQAEPPVLGKVAYRAISALEVAEFVLDVESPVLADVPETGGDGIHATPSPCHLDDDLRSAADNRRLDS